MLLFTCFFIWSSLAPSQPHISTPGHVNLGVAEHRLIHFIWIDVLWPSAQPATPARVVATINMWKAYNPRATIKLWRNADVRSHFPMLLTSPLKAIKTGAWFGDILRYHIIATYGGLYLDTDTTPLKPLPAWAFTTAFTVCEKPREFESVCTQAANGIIGAPANHTALVNVARRSVERSVSYIRQAPPRMYIPFKLSLSGPPLWTKHLDGITVIAYDWFLPCSYQNRSTCRAGDYALSRSIGLHVWAKSWK